MDQTTVNTAQSLRSLYYVRSAVQPLWAIAVMMTSSTNPTAAGVLLILYPLWDVACTAYEIKTSSSPQTTQKINLVLGLATAAGIASTIFTHEAFAIATFGAWALAAGLLQLATGVLRRKQIGGQVAMILSGAQSTAAGAAFLLGGLALKVHVKDIAGYAIFGAVYFLIGAFFLGRKLAKDLSANPSPTLR